MLSIMRCDLHMKTDVFCAGSENRPEPVYNGTHKRLHIAGPARLAGALHPSGQPMTHSHVLYQSSSWNSLQVRSTLNRLTCRCETRTAWKQ